VMTCIATHPEEVLSTTQIADEAHLELPTVSKLLKALGHAGLVASFRGVNGGYFSSFLFILILPCLVQSTVLFFLISLNQ
jgi:hypothetical protein